MGFFSNFFGSNRTIKRTVLVTNGNINAERDYTTSTRLDVKSIRDIYHNLNNSYALSAALTKPIINANVTFIAEPEIITEDEKLRDFMAEQDIPYSEVHKMAEREGDIWVWPQWDIDKKSIKYEIFPVDSIKAEYIDPITKKTTGIKFSENVQYNDLQSKTFKNITVETLVTAEEITRYRSDRTVPEVIPNPFGFIPIVQFSNNKESAFERRGHSEIENIEPQLKQYHDTMFENASAQKRNGHPKMTVTTEDPKAFIVNNYGDAKYSGVKKGTDSINLDSKDLFILKPNEDMKYLTNSSALGDGSKLLEVIFTLIVEGSETPEVMFGANLGTSLASVKEQRPVWIKKIENKQKQYTQSWEEVIDIALAIYNFTTFNKIAPDYELKWNVPDFKDEKESSEIAKAVSEILSTLKLNNLISDKEAYKTLKKYQELNLEETFDKHKEGVDKTARDSAVRNLDDQTMRVLDEAGMVDGDN